MGLGVFEPRFRRIAGVVLGVVTAGAALGVAVPPPAFAATAPTISSGVAAYTPSSTPGAPAGTPLASQFDVLTLVSGGAASVNTSSLYVVTTPSSGSVSATPSASNGIITFQPSSTTSGPQILQFAYCSPGYTYPNSTACTTSTLTFEPVASIQAVGESLSVGGSDAVVVQNVGMAVTGPASLPIGSTVSLSVASAPEQVPSTVPYGTGSISVTSLAGMTDIIPVPSGLSYVQGSLSVTGGDSTTSGQLTVTYCTASGTGCTAQLGVGNYQTTAPYFELALPSTTTVPAGSQYTVPTVTAQFTVSGTAGSVADLALTETMAGVTVQNGVSAQPLAFDGYPTSIGTTADPPPYQMPTPMFTGTIAAVPGQPAITSLLPGNAQVTVGWNPPSTTGGNSITGYVITWYVAGSVAGSTSVGNLASTTIGNLTDGTAYTFTVAATNSVGTGPASSPDGPVDPFTTPGAPTIGTAVAGNTEATVAWTVGPDNGALIESYTITPYIGTTAQTPVVVNAVAGTSTDPTPGYSDSYVITGLTNGTAYTFVVSESNLAGASQTSFASNAVTPAVSITPPSAPTIGVASAGKGTATVTWTVGSDNGAVISDFVITPYIGVTAQAPLTITAGAVGSSTDPTPNAQDSTTISGLTNGTTYSFTVAATNSGGTGQPSALSNLVTPYTVPSTITIGTAVAGSSSATVAWKVGSDGGSAITYFIITPYANGVAQATVNVPAVSGSSTSPTQGSSDSFVLSGLVDGTSYSFRVRAVNAAGTSLYSAASNTVTPATVPGAPTIGTATSGNTQATVTWTVGPNNGSAITSFTVTPYVGTTAGTPVVVTAGATGSATAPTPGASDSATITGLTNGTAYTFTVAATNAVGTGPASSASNTVTPATVTSVLGVSVTLTSDGTDQVSTYEVRFETSSSGALTAGSEIVLTFAPGTVLPPSSSDYAISAGAGTATVSGVTLTPAGSSSGPTAVITLGTASIAGSDDVSMVISSLRNPLVASATDECTVRTSADTSPVSAAYGIVGAGAVHGYYLVASDGGVFSFGGASYYGSMGGHHLNQPVNGMTVTPDGKGYWLVASDGGIFTFGDAHFYGSLGNAHLNAPIVGMATARDGKGYWLVASDGGIFTFGDAHFYGSGGGHRLDAPIVGMAATPDGGGYWLVAADGGVFAFGDAPFHGSAARLVLSAPIVGITADVTTDGYWLTGADGGIFTGGAPFYGSLGNVHLNAPIVGFGS